jgi:hypothetical protein
MNCGLKKGICQIESRIDHVFQAVMELAFTKAAAARVLLGNSIYERLATAPHGFPIHTACVMQRER